MRHLDASKTRPNILIRQPQTRAANRAQTAVDGRRAVVAEDRRRGGRRLELHDGRGGLRPVAMLSIFDFGSLRQRGESRSARRGAA